MDIQRASLAQQNEASQLLNEYYDAIDVVKRDTPQDIVRFLDDPDSAMWIAWVEGKPAACVILRPLPGIALAAECKRLYVRQQYRGHGIADALLLAMHAHAAGRGLAWIYLDSNDTLKAALRLYTRHGYLHCARYNDNPQATVFLRKALPG